MLDKIQEWFQGINLNALFLTMVVVVVLFILGWLMINVPIIGTIIITILTIIAAIVLFCCIYFLIEGLLLFF